MDIGKLIKEIHDKKAMSYATLGKIFDVSPVTVYYWASGKKKPKKEKLKQIMPAVEDLLEIAMYIPTTSERNYNGPPANEFSWRTTDPPLLKKILNYMVHYAGVLGINNRVMMDTAAYFIRQLYAQYKVPRSQAQMLALACLAVAAFKHNKTIEIADLITDQDAFWMWWDTASHFLIEKPAPTLQKSENTELA